jgi:hypothetical protein
MKLIIIAAASAAFLGGSSVYAQNPNRGLKNLRPALPGNRRWAPRKLLIPEPQPVRAPSRLPVQWGRHRMAQRAAQLAHRIPIVCRRELRVARAGPQVRGPDCASPSVGRRPDGRTSGRADRRSIGSAPVRRWGRPTVFWLSRARTARSACSK